MDMLFYQIQLSNPIIFYKKNYLNQIKPQILTLKKKNILYPHVYVSSGGFKNFSQGVP